MQAPTDVPELLGLLAIELDATLARLLPASPLQEREQLAVDLMHACRTTVGGHRLRVAPHIPAGDLRADPAYCRLYDAWHPMIAKHSAMPTAWVDVAVLQLIDTLRKVVKGEHIPKKRYISAERDVDEMYRRFRGDFRALGLELGLSGERVRQLLTPLMKAEAKRRQPDLFGDD